ncbi:MAG: hypothetical protein RXO71_05775 [Nitrososphaeria archaeon]
MDISKGRLNEVYFPKDLKEGVIKYAREKPPQRDHSAAQGKVNFI